MTVTRPALPSLPVARTGPFDPPPEYARLRRECPVSRLVLPDGSTGWLVSTYDMVRAVLGDGRFGNVLIQASAVSQVELTQEERRVPPGAFGAMDPPEHTRYRRALAPHLTLRRIARLRPRIEQIVNERLAEMTRTGPPVDLVEAFAVPVPALAISELLGVPVESRAAFHRQATTLVTLKSDAESQRSTYAEMARDTLALVQAKRERAGDDLLSALIHTDDRRQPLTDEELTNIAMLLLIAGHETTGNMIAFGMFALLERPDQLAALHRDRTLRLRAVDELLRYLSILHFGLVRVARQDVELGGRRIRAGETVMTSLASANRDPAHFADPDTLDVTRRYSPHVAFGFGVHQCIGQHLARIEMSACLDGLLRLPRLRLAVAAAQVRLRDDMAIYGVHELPVTWDVAPG